MIALARMLPDTSHDAIGVKLKQLQGLTRWTGEKHRLVAEIEKSLNQSRYKGWLADHRDYRISRVGQSYQYDVPTDKRGHLHQFRGKRVRLVCMPGGKFISTVGLCGRCEEAAHTIMGTI
jgi:hypothetical protein